jgi:hypothetical protein
MKELIDEVIELYQSKSADEMEKKFGWRNPFRSNSQAKNEYVKKDKYVNKKEGVEKLENLCRKYPEEWSNTSHRPIWTDPNGMELRGKHIKSKEVFWNQVKQKEEEQQLKIPTQPAQLQI